MSPKCYRAGWISDVHPGTRGAQSDALLEFLRTHEFETLTSLAGAKDRLAARE